MLVPKMSQLRPGVRVNIVLKKDQPTGKLTTGSIADILTRGDHPRGIKVRLQSGDIGRVQSVLPANAVSSHDGPVQGTGAPSVNDSSVTEPTPNTMRESGGRYKMQDDYRLDPTPRETLSLEDYIKPSRKKGKGKNAKAGNSTKQPEQLQAQLEKEYSNLDSALIAAILADHSTPEEAIEVLKSLS